MSYITQRYICSMFQLNFLEPNLEFKFFMHINNETEMKFCLI